MARRVLQLLFAIGCLVSAAASGRFTVRLILDGAISFAFIPLFDVLTLMLVMRLRPGGLPRPARMLEYFTDGYRPWLLWMVFVTAVALLVPPRDIYPWILRVALSGIVPVIMAIRTDRHFFTDVMRRGQRAARVDVVVHRTLLWIACFTYFFGIAIWYDTLPGMLASLGWR